MKRELYPANWREISASIRARAEDRCECRGVCGDDHAGRCDAPNRAAIVRHLREPWRWMDAERWAARLDAATRTEEIADLDDEWSHDGVKVVLTVAHVDHDPSNNDPANLRALCQRCHLVLDRHQHARNAAETRRSRKAAGELPGVGR